MPDVFVTRQAGGVFGNTGKFFYAKPTPAPSDIFEASLPGGLNRTKLKPCGVVFNFDAKSRLLLTGGWTDNLVFTENFALLAQGIIAPTNAMVLGAGAGLTIGVTSAAGPGTTGNAICYVSFWDDVHGRRSPLSGPSPILALANQSVVWSNLPVTCPDTSVTHIELWRSMDGAAPRLVLRRQLGSTTVTENTATLALGEAFLDNFTKFPRCRWNVVWHDRQVMAGDDRFPDRLYFSILNQPEQYGYFYLRTRKGEKIVALAVVRDNLIVFGAKSSYVVTGYTEDDIQMNILEPSLGCINHFCIADLHGLALIPAHLGWYLCTGSSLHHVSQDFQWFWRSEYAANESLYETEAWAVNDIETNTYKLWAGPITQVTEEGATYGYWVIDYTSMIAEVGGNFGRPKLSFDARNRRDEAGGVLGLPGSKRGTLYVGSCDGYVRRENVDTNHDDDGDAFGKKLVIATPHYYFGGEGGDPLDSYSWTGWWSYMESERNAYTLDLYTGDDKAYQYFAPSYTEAVPAGEELDGLNELAPTVPRWHEPMISGRGITAKFTVPTPRVPTSYQKGVTWLGFGCSRKPGPNNNQVITNNSPI